MYQFTYIQRVPLAFCTLIDCISVSLISGLLLARSHFYFSPHLTPSSSPPHSPRHPSPPLPFVF